MNALLLDASAVEAFLFCERRFYMQHVLRRVPESAGPAQRFGHALHKMLAYRFRWPARFRVDVCERYFRRALREAWDHRNAEMATRVIDMFHSTVLPKLGWQPVQSDRGPLVEFRFVTHLWENVYWHGLVDLVIERDGDLWVVDHKTSTAFWPRAWALDHQLLGYCWAVQQVTQTRCAGFIVNQIRVTTLSPRPEDFRTETVLVPSAVLEDWYRNMSELAHRIVNEKFWPMRPVSCWSRFGECPYYIVCSAAPDQRDAVLQSNLFHEKVRT